MNRLATWALVLAAFGATAASDDIPPPRPVDVAALIRQLGSDDFAEREAAMTRLGALAFDPPPSLLALTKAPNADLRERAAKVAQQMRWNVATTRLPRGRRYAEDGRVDLFVAATAVWDLKPDDPRLWEPAADLGRVLIEGAELKGDRKPHNCPSSYPSFAIYKKQCAPLFTRKDVAYRPEIFRNESIQAPAIVAPSGLRGIIVSRGNIESQSFIWQSVVLANGDITATSTRDSVIICDGDVVLTGSEINTCLVVARGNIRVKGGARASYLAAGGKVVLGKKLQEFEGYYNQLLEDATHPLGIKFFELAEVGIKVKSADEGVVVTYVFERRAFAAAGVKIGDIITEVNGKKPDTAESLRRLLRDALALGDATLTLKRGEKTETVKVSLPE